MQYWRRRNPKAHPFMFATGIENSYPTVPGKEGNPRRVDEMEKTFHYQRWKEDFNLVREMGLHFLRYGPPYYKTHLGPGKYDWAFTDETFQELKNLDIEPIADLCHFGVPDWIGNFQNSEWPELFAEFARVFASRYQWVKLFTPVNEIFVCANFSAKLGWWNEAMTDDLSFITALKNLTKANLLAEEAILSVQPQALFIQSESSEHFHFEDPTAIERAVFYNQLRFLSLDLSYGNQVDALMYEYLLDNGMTRAEYHWYLEHGRDIKPHCVMGNDYYATNEHIVPPGNAPLEPAGEVFGYYIITREYFNRYYMPVMHTETNQRGAEDAPYWLRKQWANMIHLKYTGVPIIGFTWYSLIDQVDWDSALREDNGNINALGLCDINRQITPVGRTYKRLVERWRDILPMESLGLELTHLQV